MDAKAELNQELRRARGWILGVGIVMFCFDMLFTYVIWGDRIPADLKTKVLMLDLGILAVFVALWWFAQYKPKLCCILALCAFWGLQLYNASVDPTMLYKGIVIKVLFTMALVKGIKSGARAEELQSQLGKVFE
jgi:hypothetical protein